MHVARVAVVAGAIAVCMMHVFACGDPTHVYSGRLYREDRACLATPSSLDVVTGDEPGTCEAVCLVQRSGDGGRAVYVSTMCAPYPEAFEATGTDFRCPGALAALSRDDTCLADGSTSPAPRDASADAPSD